jgi:thiol-disulfide isomerase/thioredoxin
MTPARRRSLLLGVVIGLVIAVALAFVLSRPGDDQVDARLDTPGAATSEAGIPVAGAVQGDPVPAIVFETFDGTHASFADLRGKPVVVNVWASTCAPCVKEMPAFEKVHQQFGDKVAFVGINNQDSLDAARELASKTGVTYPLWQDQRGDFFVDMKLAAMPTTVLVSSAGTVVATQSGAMDEAKLTALINDKLLS